MLLSAGNLDPAFSGDGILTGRNKLVLRGAEAVALQPDGRVVVAGYRSSFPEGGGGPRDLLVSRFNADGTRDASFGAGGSVVADLGGDDAASAVKVDGQGRIVVGATAAAGLPTAAWAVLRLRPDGTPDPSFGDNGRFTLPANYAGGGLTDLALAPGGKVVAVGSTGEGGSVVLRLTPGGTPDTTFGAAGNGLGGWGIARLDGTGTAGGVTWDPHFRTVTVKGNLTADDVRLAVARGRLFVSFNGSTYNFPRTLRKVRVYGRDGDDRVTVTSALRDLVVRGGAGDDLIRGGPGRDWIEGSDGDDTLDGGLGSDFLYGGAGIDSVDYRSRTLPVRVRPVDFGYPDSYSGQAGEHDAVYGDIEKVYGGSGDDDIIVPARYPWHYGGAAFGGPGNDTLKGTVGPDALWGEAGDDVLVNSLNADYFRGGPGNDTFLSIDPGGVTHYAGGPADVSLDGRANDGARDYEYTGHSEGDNVYSDIENVVGTPEDDLLTGSAADNRLEGRGGNDTLVGLAGDDTLLGGDGDDTLTDTQGTNTLDGGPGTDTINGVVDPPGVLSALAARSVGGRPRQQPLDGQGLWPVLRARRVADGLLA